MGGVKLASNKEEELLLELLPTVANGFLKRRRAEENEKVMAVAAAKAAEEAAKTAATQTPSEPVTGPTLTAPMGGTVISVNVKTRPTSQEKAIFFLYMRQ